MLRSATNELVSPQMVFQLHQPTSDAQEAPEPSRSLTSWAGIVSLVYIAIVLGAPLVVNLGICSNNSAHVLCWLLPSTALTEFDKWGSYLSGALVPLSLVWVGLAFRLQQRQLLEQGRQQARASEIAFESQRIADRQTLSALAPTYLTRMDAALRDFAELINSNLYGSTEGEVGGRVPDEEVATSMSAVGSVFTTYHNRLIGLARGELGDEEAHDLKQLFIDSDMSDYLDFFFEPFNEFERRCRDLDCMILMPPHVRSMAGTIKWNFLRSTWRWHPDQTERLRLARLVGWTASELQARFAEQPEDEVWDPYDAKREHERLASQRRRSRAQHRS